MKLLVPCTTILIALTSLVGCQSNLKPNVTSSSKAMLQKCEVANKQGNSFKVCMTQGMFSHDNYKFFVNNQEIYKGIDDDITSFTSVKNGITYIGGCKPVNELMDMGGMKVPVETKRNCAISFSNQTIDGVSFSFN